MPISAADNLVEKQKRGDERPHRQTETGIMLPDYR
jgi:hypothetical protein